MRYLPLGRARGMALLGWLVIDGSGHCWRVYLLSSVRATRGMVIDAMQTWP
jgi:hypothetical protein